MRYRASETRVHTTAVEGMTCGMVFLLLAVASSMTANHDGAGRFTEGQLIQSFLWWTRTDMTALGVGSITFWAVGFPVAWEEFLTVSRTPYRGGPYPLSMAIKSRCTNAISSTRSWGVVRGVRVERNFR